MKITFYRQGHSNNSSSSHSLIFTEELPRDTSSGSDFGWDWFVCSDRDSKLSYIVSCLRSSWMVASKVNCYFSIPWHNKSLYSRDCRDFREDFDKNVNKLFRSFLTNEIGIDISEVDLDGYGVDHQSQITFPLDRDGQELNVSFAKKFIKEFVDGNWYVYGGNDNEDACYDSPTDRHYLPPDKQDYASVWNFLQDLYVKELTCVYDNKTEEYVISHPSGLMKIKF
jgi:hypothetical protein